MARIAWIISSMRAAGRDHGIEKRLVMWAWIWLPSPSRNRPPRQRLQVPGDVRQHHRVAGEAHRDGGHQLDPLGVLGRQRQGQEGVVAGLGRQQPAVAVLLHHPGPAADGGELVAAGRLGESDPGVDLHGRLRVWGWLNWRWAESGAVADTLR
ncbi:MAG: hypothetical protein OXL98_07700 [Acidimicrobiaceae bacterium]|nr:hypothetical protein [Acidimicrobiaceae bacterium]